jgi:two-component system chemotaxis response regulator CheY
MAHSILIVDDSATTRALIKRVISMCGIEVGRIDEAGNGKAALERLAAAPSDLVLADLNMPEMDGVEMAGRILADPRLRHIPVIVISAEPQRERLEQLKRQGIRGYLRKPFTPESIRDVITGIFGGCHAQPVA